MTHPIVLKTAALIRVGDLAGAELALTTIAEDHGDNALIEVLDEVPPMDLVAIMREFDSSKESIINLLVTPEQFANAVTLEWRYADPNHDHLRGMMNAVLFRDPDKTAEFLHTLGEREDGLRTLANYFSGRFEELWEFATTGNFGGGIYGSPENTIDPDDVPFDSSERFDPTVNVNFFDAKIPPKVTRVEITDNDWMESAWVLKYQVPKLFEDLITHLSQLKKVVVESETEGPSGHEHKDAVPTTSVGDEESAL